MVYRGKTGILLLDPSDITINDIGGGVGTFDGGYPTNVYTPSGTPDNILKTTVQSNLAVSNVLIKTNSAALGSGNITVSSAITWNARTTLMLYAELRLSIDAAITNTNNGINFDAMDFQAFSGTTADQGALIVNAALTTVSGNIILYGTGYDDLGNIANNIGIWIAASISSSGSGSITLTGTGGDGTSGNRGIYTTSAISVVNGNMSLTGVAGNGTTFDNDGIYIGAAVSSSGTGSITLTGTGGAGTSGNYGVNVGSTITAANSAISITGTGGDGSTTGNYGVNIGGAITASLASSVTISGTGGAGTSTNYGIYTTSAISVVNGNMSLTGVGGSDGTAGSNYGIYITTAGLSSSGTGSITLTGTGGAGTASNYGVYLTNTISSTSTGTVTITGTGRGTTTNNYGVYNDGGSGTITSSGDISITGTGANGTSDNYGTYISDAVTATGSASITMNGTGGSGSSVNNHGIYLLGDISVVNGSMSLTGTGNGSGGGSAINNGIYTLTSGTISSSGSGSITLNGTGSSVNADNYGVYLTRPISSTSTGTVTITGTGAGTTSSNIGFTSLLSGTIASSSGNISITGTGANGTSNNYGMYIGATVTATGAASITMNGTGGSGTISNDGVLIVTTISAVTGNITITGTGSGTSGIGVNNNSGTIRTTSSGTLTITGIGAGSSVGISNNSGDTIGGASQTGDITLNADSVDYSSGTFVTGSNLIVQPITAALAIPIGTGGTNYMTAAGLQAVGSSNVHILFIGRSDGTHTITLGDGSGNLTVNTTTWFRGQNFILTEPISSSGNAVTLLGNTANNTVTGANINSIWDLTTANGGLINSVGVRYQNIQNLTGGTADDTFKFYNGGSVSGIVDGGNNSGNTLDYTNYSLPVYIDMTNKTATATGGWNRIQFFLGHIIFPFASEKNQDMFLAERNSDLFRLLSPIFYMENKIAREKLLKDYAPLAINTEYNPFTTSIDEEIENEE